MAEQQAQLLRQHDEGAQVRSQRCLPLQLYLFASRTQFDHAAEGKPDRGAVDLTPYSAVAFQARHGYAFKSQNDDVQHQQWPDKYCRRTDHHHGGLVAFTQTPAAKRALQSGRAQSVAAKAYALPVPKAAGIRCLHRCAMQPRQATQIQVFGDGSKPFGKAAKRVPQRARYEKTCPDCNCDVASSGIKIRNQVVEWIEQAAAIDEFACVPVVLR